MKKKTFFSSMEMSDKYIIWLDSAIPLSGEKPPNRVNTEIEGFFPLYNIFENRSKKNTYIPCRVWGGKDGNWKRELKWKEVHTFYFCYTFFFFYSGRAGVFSVDILYVVIRSGMYIIFMEFVCILTPWFIEIWAKSEMDA